MTCHDGFTLNDLVSYNEKHNEANGEDNRDGANDNRSWNCGVEGPTDDPGGRGAAQPAGEELPDRHAAFARRADDPDGRRSAAHAGRQQQRLLPGQRDQLVRLDAAREARGRASVREPARRAAIAARRGARAPAREPERLLGEANKAWHGVKLNQPDWSDARTASPSARRFEARGCSPPDPECLLGAARLRVAGRGPRVRGDDGSTRPSTRRTTSSRGKRHRRCQAAPISAAAPPRSSCYSGSRNPE